MTKFYIAKDNIRDVQKAAVEQIATALEAVGVQAVGHAVANITEQGAVDTGLLRNSITYALDGETPKIASYLASSGSNKSRSGKRYSSKSSKVAAGLIHNPLKPHGYHLSLL